MEQVDFQKNPTMQRRKPMSVYETRLGAVKAVIWENETSVGVRNHVAAIRLYKDGDEWRAESRSVGMTFPQRQKSSTKPIAGILKLVPQPDLHGAQGSPKIVTRIPQKKVVVMAKKRSKKAKSNGNFRRRPDRDRRVRQADRLARILRVLEMIQSRGRWTRNAIADELQCSERTIYRDLNVLEFAGIPYYYEGDQHFLRVRQDFRFPALALNQDEILGLTLAGVLTDTPGLDVTAGADPTSRKIAAAAADDTAELIDDARTLMTVLDLKFADHSQHRETIRTIQRTLLAKKRVSGKYESPYENGPLTLTVHPYRLCLIKRAWYIVGHIDGERTAKTFRVARFKSLRMLDQAASIPEDFDLRQHFGNAWAVYRGEQTYDIELHFTPKAAPIVTETQWHHTQQVTKHRDGSITMTFTVDGLEEILRWVLSWTGQVTIVKPDDLRQRFAETLQSGLDMNS